MSTSPRKIWKDGYCEGCSYKENCDSAMMRNCVLIMQLAQMKKIAEALDRISRR